MIISIAKLKRHPGKIISLKLSHALSSFDLAGQKIRFDSPVEVKGEIELKDTTVLVSGQVRTKVVLTCSRCLEEYLLGLEADFSERFVPAELTSVLEDQDEYRVYEGNEIDLAPVILENIILSLPMQQLCTAECRGICAVCGIDMNTKECHCLREDSDARLTVLAQLLPLDK
jgi:uncharacterized protein